MSFPFSSFRILKFGSEMVWLDTSSSSFRFRVKNVDDVLICVDVAVDVNAGIEGV